MFLFIDMPVAQSIVFLTTFTTAEISLLFFKFFVNFVAFVSSCLSSAATPPRRVHLRLLYAA
jgi:hypothetical protein